MHLLYVYMYTLAHVLKWAFISCLEHTFTQALHNSAALFTQLCSKLADYCYQTVKFFSHFVIALQFAGAFFLHLFPSYTAEKCLLNGVNEINESLHCFFFIIVM